MASRKKKSSSNSDTITFKKSELLSKLKDFLEEEDACDGDWLNKVRVRFLGEKEQEFTVRLQYETTIRIPMLVMDKLPTVEEVTDKINVDIDDGMLDIDLDNLDFKVIEVKKSGT